VSKGVLPGYSSSASSSRLRPACLRSSSVHPRQLLLMKGNDDTLPCIRVIIDAMASLSAVT